MCVDFGRDLSLDSATSVPSWVQFIFTALVKPLPERLLSVNKTCWIYLGVTVKRSVSMHHSQAQFRRIQNNRVLATHHFSFGAEESVTLQGLVVLALGNVCKHFVMHLVRCAVRYSEANRHTLMRAQNLCFLISGLNCVKSDQC